MGSIEELIAHASGFEWDSGNSGKNLERHGVSDSECEEVFFNEPLIAGQDLPHSQKEQRYYAYGHTDGGRHLFLVFTLRGDRIRVISARDMNKKERGGRMKRLKRIPVFKSEDEEREFWATHDSTEYIDVSAAKRVALPNLKPTTKAISIRMPTHVLEKLKMLANKKDIPYQSLLKMLLTEKVEEELRGPAK